MWSGAAVSTVPAYKDRLKRVAVGGSMSLPLSGTLGLAGCLKQGRGRAPTIDLTRSPAPERDAPD